jgi:hypothetical protein
VGGVGGVGSRLIQAKIQNPPYFLLLTSYFLLLTPISQLPSPPVSSIEKMGTLENILGNNENEWPFHPSC